MQARHTVRMMRWAVLLLVAVLGASGPAPAQAPQAGTIARLIPVGHVIRDKRTLEAKKDMPLLWGDTVRTERGGRVRVQLEDGSLLNVGSESSLVIEKHDAASQQTSLELVYGRVRANAVRVARPGGGFNVRTKTAVAGIVGTEEYVEASDIVTTIIALGGGEVSVVSTDARFPEPILLSPGELAVMVAGQRGQKRLATAEELNRAVQQTEVDSVATLSPGQVLPGRTLEATVTGRGLDSATGVSFDHAGLQVQVSGDISATQIPVTITVAADVPVGTYYLSIERPEGPARANLVVVTEAIQQELMAQPRAEMQPPASFNLSAVRGAKFTLDASGTRTPAGTAIVLYQWRILNTSLASNDTAFYLNTSLLAPGNYTVQLTVVNDAGQSITQQYPLSVSAGLQPAEIVREIAVAYESLQPSRFLANFDEQKFRNYSGFAAAIENSFRNQLETVRVFQRPVNCAVLEAQDQAICQAEFELQFTKKDQPTELLDPQGNPVPPGATPPGGSALGKRILTGNERNTLRFERGDAGWKVVDYSAVVSCPGGTSTTGVNVGSCVLALGTSTAPSFLISNLQVFSTDLPLGGSVSGFFDIVPVAGFASPVDLSGQGLIGNQSVTVQFTPAQAQPGMRVSFTVFAPTQLPTGFSGPTPFTLVINGRDPTGTVTAGANLTLVLQPDFAINVSPTTSSSAPAPVTHNSTLQLSVQVIPGLGFSGNVFVDFPNLPAGFQAMSGNVAAGSTVPFPVQVLPAAVPGPAQITVRATFGSGFIRTATVFVDVISNFGLSVTPVSTSTSPIPVIVNSSFPLTVQIVPISGFAGTVRVGFPNLPAGFQATPATSDIAAGASSIFQISVGAVPVGPAQFAVRGSVGPGTVQTVTVFVNVSLTVPALPLARAQASPTTASPPAVQQVLVPVATAGTYTPVIVSGESLSQVTAVESDSPQVVVSLEPGATDTRLELSVFVRPGTPPGRHTLLLKGPQGIVPIAFEVGTPDADDEDSVDRRTAQVPARWEDEKLSSGLPGTLREPREQSVTRRPRVTRRPSEEMVAHSVLRVEEIRMSPMNPRPGDAVTFRVRVSNSGSQPVEDVALEFSIEGAAVRERETFSLEPGAGQTFLFGWQAAGAGHLTPRLVIDPERRVANLDRASTVASLPSFELSAPADQAASAPGFSAMPERAQVQLLFGGCAGFQLATGTAVSCDTGADFELRFEGGALLIVAEGVRNLGTVALDQLQATPGEALGRTAPVQRGATYVIQTRRQLTAVRVAEVRGLGSSRGATPRSLRGPKLGDVERDPGPNERPVTLLLEWKLLSDR